MPNQTLNTDVVDTKRSEVSPAQHLWLLVSIAKFYISYDEKSVQPNSETCKQLNSCEQPQNV